MMTTIDNYFDRLKKTIDNIDKNEIKKVVNILLEARDNEKQIFIMGNGGSASTASHFACDINKGTKQKDKKPFRVICLNDNIPTMLAYANDSNYDNIFIEQLENLLKPGDVVIGISGSGNSNNIINAIGFSNFLKITTVGITGFDGGMLKQMSKHSINTNIDDMQISEDIHMILVHVIMKAILNEKL